MDFIRDYLLSIIGGAMICGVILQIIPKGQYLILLKLLCGLFLTMSLLHPLIHMNWQTITDEWTLAKFEDGESIAAMGQRYSEKLLVARIKQEAEEYIFDKAAAFGLCIHADVEVSQSDIPVPVSVRLSGAADVTDRERLMQIIFEELGISKENQLWTEENSTGG